MKIRHISFVAKRTNFRDGREEIHFMHSRSPAKIKAYINQVTQLCKFTVTPRPHYFAMLGILHRTVHFDLSPSPRSRTDRCLFVDFGKDIMVSEQRIFFLSDLNRRSTVLWDQNLITNRHAAANPLAILIQTTGTDG